MRTILQNYHYTHVAKILPTIPPGAFARGAYAIFPAWMLYIMQLMSGRMCPSHQHQP